MKKNIFLFLVGLFFLGQFFNVYADQVYTNGAQRYSGEVVENEDGTISIKNEQGTIFLGKADVLHIEKTDENKMFHNAKEEEALSVNLLINKATDCYKRLSNNKWFILRQPIYKNHLRFFSCLNKNSFYSYFANKPFVRDYRIKNPVGYIIAVYMFAILVLAFVLNLLDKTIFSVIKGWFGIKTKYDL